MDAATFPDDDPEPAVAPTPPTGQPPPAGTALYRVKAGHTLPHLGTVLPAGASVRLMTTVATDHQVAYRIEPVS